MWAQIFNILVGIWLMIAPEILNYEKQAAQMNFIFGPLVATFASIAIAECTRSIRLWNIPIGVWLIIQPFVLHYSINIEIINSIIPGIIIILFSLIKGNYDPSDFGGGWNSLLKRN